MLVPMLVLFSKAFKSILILIIKVAKIIASTLVGNEDYTLLGTRTAVSQNGALFYNHSPNLSLTSIIVQ